MKTQRTIRLFLLVVSLLASLSARAGLIFGTNFTMLPTSPTTLFTNLPWFTATAGAAKDLLRQDPFTGDLVTTNSGSGERNIRLELLNRFGTNANWGTIYFAWRGAMSPNTSGGTSADWWKLCINATNSNTRQVCIGYVGVNQMDLGAGVGTSGATYTNAYFTTLNDGSPNLFVAKIVFNPSGNETITGWVNPTGVETGPDSATITTVELGWTPMSITNWACGFQYFNAEVATRGRALGTQDGTPAVAVGTNWTEVVGSLPPWRKPVALAWDSDPGTAGAQGGTGTWNAANNFWHDGAANNLWTNTYRDVAQFGGTAGTVTVSGTNMASGLQFDTNGYVLDGSGMVVLSGLCGITNAGSATIAAPIGGLHDLAKAGVGLLTLTANNPYSGTLTVAEGAVQIGNGGTIGSIASPTLTVAGGAALIFNRSDARTNTAPIALNGALTNLGSSLTLNGALTGSGSLCQSSSGQMTLAATSTFNGTAYVNAGRLFVNAACSNLSLAYVAAGATLSGKSSLGGYITVLDAGTIQPGDVAGSGTLTFGAGSTLNLGSTSTDNTTNAFNVNAGAKIAAASLVVNGTNVVTVVGVPPSVGTYTLITYTSASTNGYGFIASLPAGVAGYIQDSGTNSIQLVITSSSIDPLVWRGDVLAEWGSGTNKDWISTNGVTHLPYSPGAPVTFDNTASAFNVNIAVPVISGTMGISNTTAYNFTGAGGISSLSFTKNGNGSVTLGNSAAISSGPLTLNAGTLNVNNAAANTFGAMTLNGGSLNVNNAAANTYSTISLNAATLAFNQPVNATIATALSGTGGSLVQQGTNSLTLSADNSGYSGSVLVTSGTLRNGNYNALGAGSLTVTNGGTLDLAGLRSSIPTVIASGAGVSSNGAIINAVSSDLTSPAAIADLTLAGDLTINNLSGRFDLATIHGNGHQLVKLGGFFCYIRGAGDTDLGDIDIRGSRLGFEAGSGFGRPANTMTIRSNAILAFYNNGLAAGDKHVVMEDTAMVLYNQSQSTFGGTMVLNGTNDFRCINSFASASQSALSYLGNISGPGALRFSFQTSGPGLVILSGTNSYSGPTILNPNGALLQVDGVISNSAVTVGSGSWLGGSGALFGPVTLQSGGTLSAGALPAGYTLGLLTISNSLNLQAGSTNQMKVDLSSGTNDVIAGMSSVNYGGTLSVSEIYSLPFSLGQSFKLFSAASYSGAFAGIIPAVPGTGLAWDTSRLTVDGTLKVGLPVDTNPTNISFSVTGTNLNLSWPTNHLGWRLLVQTNLLNVGLTPATNTWFEVPGTASVTATNFPIDPANPTVFYRLVYP